jgi:hypothetical protein
MGCGKAVDMPLEIIVTKGLKPPSSGEFVYL